MEKFLIKSGKRNLDSQESQNTKSSTKHRQYKEEYIEFGFIPSESDNSLPFCLICSKVLSNESMVPSKLLRHYESKHSDKNYNKSDFERMYKERRDQANKFKKICTVPQKAQMASYKISQLLVKTKKPHTDGEKIILPALKIAAETILDPSAVQKLIQIPLSDNTVSRRIVDMSDILSQIQEHFNDEKDPLEKKWAIQIDESTDISNKAQVIAFLRFVKDGDIVEQFFFGNIVFAINFTAINFLR
jgi:hypothetical protein